MNWFSRLLARFGFGNNPGIKQQGSFRKSDDQSASAFGDSSMNAHHSVHHANDHNFDGIPDNQGSSSGADFGSGANNDFGSSGDSSFDSGSGGFDSGSSFGD